jgi:hypothetical protein
MLKVQDQAKLAAHSRSLLGISSSKGRPLVAQDPKQERNHGPPSRVQVPQAVKQARPQQDCMTQPMNNARKTKPAT